jgi:hypothetical protein
MFNGKIHYKWPFSIAMLNYQRVPLSVHFFQTKFRPRIATIGGQKRKSKKMAWIGEGRESAASVATTSALGQKKSGHSFDDMILGLYDIPRLTKFDNAVLIMTII